MIQNFHRTYDVKATLELGIEEKLPEWMKDSGYDINDYFYVWKWAMEEGKDFIFPYIVQKRDEFWRNATKITIGMEDNNALLWESVVEMCYPAVKEILKLPDLFSQEVFNLKVGASLLTEYFYRAETKRNYRATNFGAFVQVAMEKGKGDWRIKDELMNYYRKYSNDAI